MTPAERELRGAVRRLEQLIVDQGQEIRALRTARRTPQLGHSSIDSGALEVRSPESGQRMRIGIIDGRVGQTTEGGDPVSAPTAPTVTPSLGGLRVTWDGLLAGDPAIPVDFDHMAVHVSTETGFTPSAATYVGTIRRAGEGGMLPVVPLPYVEHYARLVPVTTGGVQGVPSVEAAATPLQVDGADLTVGSVTAPIIAAGAVEADKLEALLVLATTIIGGIPGAARVEMDQDGLRGYNTGNELIFAIDSSGNAVFSGDIVASEISGSRFSLTSSSGATGVIEDTSGVVRTQVVSPAGARAQLASTSGQAEFSVWGDAGSPTTPAGGMLATPGSCQVNLLSNVSDTTTSPLLTMVALPTEARVQARGGTGSDMRLTAQDAWAGVSATPEPSTMGQPSATPGTIYAFRRSGTDAPTLSLQSPVSTSGAGADRRSIIHVEGANTARAYTIINSAARRFYVQGELVGGSTDTATDGVFELAPTHSFYAPRHAPVRTDMATAPGGGATGTWIPFSGSAWPPITFKTGWSGKARVTITAAAGNNNSATSTIHFGFGLTGGSSVPAAVARAWSARGVVMQCCSRVVHLDLNANAEYTLTPHWNYNNGTVGGTVTFYTTYEFSMVVEPLP